MNRNHVCDICDAEATSWLHIPLTEGWLNEDGYISDRKTSLVICDDCFKKLREMIVEFQRTVTFYSGDRPVETVVVHKQPTVNVEPVRHGHWVKSNKSEYNWECSCCGYGLSNYRTTYCYDCGARMDEVKDDT